MGTVARKAAVSTIVVIAIVALALALWKLKVVIALVFLGFVLAAAMRPGIDRLAAWRIPRPAGLALHYLAIAGALALLLWLAVPRAIDQVSQALGGVPTSRQELNQQAKHSSGLKHQVLTAVQSRLQKLPKAGSVFHGATAVGVKAFEILVGIVFVFATAAYWIFEREQAIRLVNSLVPQEHRRVVRDTWELIDLKLGAFVRGQLVLIAFVATVLSAVLLGDRSSVLAPDRSVRRRRRGRSGDRAAGRWGARRRGRPDAVVAPRLGRGHRACSSSACSRTTSSSLASWAT